MEQKTETKKQEMTFKIFDMYDISNVNVNDAGLKNAISLQSKLALKSHGRNVQKFGQTKVNVVERLINKIGVAGHRGKKHRIILGTATGKYTKNVGMVIEAFKLIEKRTGKSPVEILVRAIENSAPRDEVTVIEYGGARYPQAVDVSPLRRVNLALKHIVHGASDKAFGKKKSLSASLADEIILASENNGESFAVKKRNEAEKQADSAR